MLFTNGQGEMTEGSFNSLLIRKDGVFFVPPVACGLLPGIFRKSLFGDKNIRIMEKILRPADLKAADEIYVANAVRGLVKVDLVT